MRERIPLADVVAELHPQPAEHVLASVDVAGGNRAPEGVAARDLHDRALTGSRERGVDEIRIGFPLHPDDPAHDVDALVVPAGVRAGFRVAADPRGVARAGRRGYALLDVRSGGVFRGLVEMFGGGEAVGSGRDRVVERPEVAEFAPRVAGSEEAAAGGFEVGGHCLGAVSMPG